MRAIWRFRFRRWVMNSLRAAPGQMLCALGRHRWDEKHLRCLRPSCRHFADGMKAWDEILTVLLGGPRFGLELAEMVKERTGGAVHLRERIYPLLREMEREGLLVSREGVPLVIRGGRPRIYYRLTKQGRKKIVQQLCEHDVKPVGDGSWGACQKCGADGFPISELAAYGEVTCSTCKDTGLVPMPAERPGFADGPCPACQNAVDEPPPLR